MPDRDRLMAVVSENMRMGQFGHWELIGTSKMELVSAILAAGFTAEPIRENVQPEGSPDA